MATTKLTKEELKAKREAQRVQNEEIAKRTAELKAEWDAKTTDERVAVRATDVMEQFARELKWQMSSLKQDVDSMARAALDEQQLVDRCIAEGRFLTLRLTNWTGHYAAKVDEHRQEIAKILKAKQDVLETLRYIGHDPETFAMKGELLADRFPPR
jgi:hypothetical protein